MSSRTTAARHRALAVHTNPLGTLSRTVSANAGTVGRQAAVIAAASGLVLAAGLPATAADTAVGVSASTETVSVSAAAITAAPTALVSFERLVVTTTPAPVVEPVPEPVVERVAEAGATPATVERTASGTTDVATASSAPAAQASPAAAPEPAPAKSGPSAAAAGLAGIAYTGIGSPYVWGGTTPGGWDCSGFTQWVYAQAGISIPRVNAWNSMTPTSNPQPGDLVMQNGGAHVGIYVGNGMMVSALNPSQGTLLHAVAATGSSSFYTVR